MILSRLQDGVPSVPSDHAELHTEGAVHHIQRSPVEELLLGLITQDAQQSEVLTVLLLYFMQKVHIHLVVQWAVYVARDQTGA